MLLLALVIIVFQYLAQNPAMILWLIAGIILIILAVQTGRKQKREDMIAWAEKTADMMDSLADNHETQKNNSLALKAGEQVLYKYGNVSLVEYASTGSTYSGTNLGVSVPLFGRVRGNIGGSQGEITKNPDVLTVVDTGTVVFTTQRIVFTGAKLVRDWEFSKILNLDVPENALSVRIAVSNRDRTSGMQVAPKNFPVGIPAYYAYTWFQEGETEARKMLKESAVNWRAEAAKFRENLKNGPEPVKPINLDSGSKPDDSEKE